jgi:hypothetical protein
MRSRMFIVLAALAAVPATVSAQANSCAATVTQDACQKAVDLFQYMAPQLGTVIAGGNATLGQGGTLGGFATFPVPHPKFSIGFRVNALQGSLPDVQNAAATPVPGNAQSSTIPVEDQVIPAPAMDVAVGLFKGLPLGLTNVGGVDLLLSAMYIPEFEGSNVSLALPDGGLKIGYGARVGLLQESLLIPGVSVTWLKRDLPKANLSGTTAAGGLEADLSVNDLEVSTTAWRVVASKSLVMFGLAVGAGTDKYKSSANVIGRSSLAEGEARVEQEMSRTNYFADLSMNLMILKIVGEVGMVQGGEVNTFNQWEGKQPADKRIYGSVGARLSF